MLQTGYAAIRKRKRDLLGYVKGSAQRWGERQLWSSLRCGHRAVKEGACAARPSGSQCRRGSRGLGFPTCKQVPWGLVWTRRHTKGSAPLLACSPIRPGRPGPSDPGGPPCWDPQAQESPDGGDGSSSPVFPSPRQVTGSGNTNQQQQETDVREAPFLFPVSSPAPATPGPLTRGPTTAHDSPWGPALLPSLCSTGPPSQMPQGQAGPPPRPPGRQLPEGSPGSHSALQRVQAQDLESTRGPWGPRARKHRPVQPFVGQLQGTRCPSLEAMETGRDSDGGGLPRPTHTRAHLHQLLRSFLHSVIHAFSH